MDMIGLLKLLEACSTLATTQNSCLSSQDAITKLFTFKQSKSMTNADYLKKFQKLVTFHGSIIGEKKDKLNVVAKDPNKPTVEETKKAKSKAQVQYFAILFVRNADKSHFGKPIANLQNSFMMDNVRYPRTMTKAYEILVNYKQFVQHVNDPNEHSISYYTPHESSKKDNEESKTPIILEVEAKDLDEAVKVGGLDKVIMVVVE
eukprot:CAMPEP_0202465410 /NCGR_PEP_ID=MMETSP1360-20130828/65509_1 /ASSEMBLY_ACC=CAM_ASM_000848 /TAXON_ID=515479 /ORGANISM="Licmophora paradoxa, Strain CCMP2313" /LENGTH=203 /DNA_ID=CAMNT_0049089145 /DNA_START=40 /DNA_END=654 /DNA_ORIENTATION=+